MNARQIVPGRWQRTATRRGAKMAALGTIAAAFWFAFGAGPAAAENWADRLGFPPGARVVVLHAHELGMCYEANAAGTELLTSGAASSASVMVPCPWFGDIAAWCRANPSADVGIELTLNSEWQDYRWQPVSPRELVPSLTDADGFLWQRPVQTMVNASADDVEHELLAQIARAKEAGIRPTHFTAHLGALMVRPDLIEAYLRVARQQWIPALVVELTPEHLERFRRLGYPLPDELLTLMDDYPLPKVDDLRFAPTADSYAEKKQALLTLIRELPPGITQIAFHPAAATDALPRITPNWQQRVWDAQLLADADIRKTLQAEGVIVTNWRELMQRFEGAAPHSDAPDIMESATSP